MEDKDKLEAILKILEGSTIANAKQILKETNEALERRYILHHKAD